MELKHIFFLIRTASILLWLVSTILGIILCLAIIKGRADGMMILFTIIMVFGFLIGIYLWKRTRSAYFEYENEICIIIYSWKEQMYFGIVYGIICSDKKEQVCISKLKDIVNAKKAEEIG